MTDERHCTNWIYTLIGLALVGTIAGGFYTLNQRVSAWQAEFAARSEQLPQEAHAAPVPPDNAVDETGHELCLKLNRTLTQAIEDGFEGLETHVDQQNAELARVLLDTLDDRLAALQQQNIDFYAQREGMASSLLDELYRVIDEQISTRVREVEHRQHETEATETLIYNGLNGTLALYREHLGHYPTVYEGELLALLEIPEDEDAAEYWDGPYVESASELQDAWGVDLWYQSPGTHNPNGYDLASSGPDGVFGTEDDITNWSDDDYDQSLDEIEP